MRFFTVNTNLCEHINKALQINLIEIVLEVMARKDNVLVCATQNHRDGLAIF